MPYYQDYLNPTIANPPTDSLSADISELPDPVIPTEMRTFNTEEQQNLSPQENIISPENPKALVLENEFYQLTLSNMGGGTVRGFIFKNYFLDDKPVNLIPALDNANLGLSYTNIYNENVSFNQYSFSNKIFDFYQNLDTLHITEPVDLEFTLHLENNKKIVRRFRFYPNKYDFDLEIELSGFQETFPTNDYSLNWDSGFNITEPHPKDDLMYSYIYARVGDEIIDLTLKDKPQDLNMSGDVKWASVRSKYFTAALIPRTKDGKSVTLSGIKTDEARDTNVKLTLPFYNSAVQVDHFTIVIAPLIDDYLESFNIKLEKMMNWGWKLIQPISFAVLFSLKFLHSFIPNYGIVLVLFSIFIKIILYPLTHKSYESMKKMQEIQPLIADLKEKHKKNPEAMNKETMAMYKEHGVNPAGGCLPMLFQMPLLYSLFIVFRTTIELRGAPFVFWITDLSNPDIVFHLPFALPLYGDGVSILPILMGATMILQQKLSGASQPNSQQKMMMYLMPVFMILIFNNFPSGLNLYYTLFNLLTILQQKYFINPSIKPMIPLTPTKSKKKR